MVKKIVVLVFVAAVLTGAAVLTTQHYQAHKNKQQHENAVVQKAASEAQASAQATAQAARAKMVEQYNLLRIECEKGKNAHDKLPAYLAKATPTPQCGAVLL